MKQFLWFVCFLPALAQGFRASGSQRVGVANPSWSKLNMAPRFDKTLNKWIPTSADEGPAGGYDIWGTVIRHGPVPFFNRIFKADDYEQGVLKFMAGDKVDRMRAQAEMDAYLSNPNDWAYNRLQGYNVDYLTINQKQLVLNLTWSVIILSLLARGAYCLATGENYWAIFGLASKAAWCEADNSCVLDALNLR